RRRETVSRRSAQTPFAASVRRFRSRWAEIQPPAMCKDSVTTPANQMQTTQAASRFAPVRAAAGPEMNSVSESARLLSLEPPTATRAADTVRPLVNSEKEADCCEE